MSLNTCILGYFSVPKVLVLSNERPVPSSSHYIETQLGLLQGQHVHAVFVFVFSFPTLRAGEGDKDLDMMSFSLVKTFQEDDPRSKNMPPWAPKKAFHRLAGVYSQSAEAEG